METNDATSAFAGLVEQMDIEKKAENVETKEGKQEEEAPEPIKAAPIAKKVAKAPAKATKPKPAAPAKKSVMQEAINLL